MAKTYHDEDAGLDFLLDWAASRSFNWNSYGSGWGIYVCTGTPGQSIICAVEKARRLLSTN